MDKKNISTRKNHAITYLNDNELQDMLRRMTQQGFDNIAAHIRRLIVLDNKKLPK